MKIFWRDEIIYCDVCVGASDIPATAQAVPVVPNFTQTDDESHGNDIESD